MMCDIWILEMGSKGSKVKDKDLKDGENETDNEKDSKAENKDEPKVPFLNQKSCQQQL